MPERELINWEAFYGSYRKPGYVPGFEILHKIGAGAFGMVFRARKESIEKDYAIKFLKVDDEGVRDAIVRELEIAPFFAQIDHPHLVSIEDRGEVDGIPYLVMSHAGDDTLRSRLDRSHKENGGPLPREQALRIFLQVARGVQALHRHSLVHFDLKPANVFLKGELARVGDYGLSRLVTQSRNSLSFGRGTPYYMAPEILRRKGDQRSDIYSLGVLLYECLTGTVPFSGDSEWEVLRKHETEAPVFPPALGEPERSVLERCLQKRPGDRFASAGELLDALQSPATLQGPVAAPAAAVATATAAGGCCETEPRASRPGLLALIPAILLALLFLAPDPEPLPPVQRLVFTSARPAVRSPVTVTAPASHAPGWLEHTLARGAGELISNLDTSDLEGELRELVDHARREVVDELREPRDRSIQRVIGRLETVLVEWAQDREDRPR